RRKARQAREERKISETAERAGRSRRLQKSSACRPVVHGNRGEIWCKISMDATGEIRNPNSEIPKKSEARMTKEKHQISPAPRHSTFGSRASFGFRISDFLCHLVFLWSDLTLRRYESSDASL